MLASNMEKLNKIKFAFSKLVKQILKKDNKILREQKDIITKHYLKDINENQQIFASEIEQNLANEQLLKATQQEQEQQQQTPTYVMSIETSVGSFYWNWECGMQRDSFADFNFKTR